MELTHISPMIRDLGFLLVTGGLVALLFSFFRQPLVVGYLLAGFMIGPNFKYFPHVTEADSIRIWGEIGVLFLLFSLGLEFSFKKLVAMGNSSFVAATIEVLGLVVLGSWVAVQLGFSDKAAFFIGAMLAISSTTMLLRAFEETGTRSARFADNVLGILIVEDLYAVLLLVLLSTVAAPVSSFQTLSGTEAVLGTLFRFGFFLIVTFTIGISLLPSLIRRIQRVLSDEMRLVLSLGFCFITVVLAANLGFSPTLGAFVMGSLLAGTREAKQIERLLLPVQQLFGAVFFISVGMQIEPSALIRHPFQAGALLLVVLLGKPLFVTLGSLVAGKPLKPAIRSGLSMAQIGEFSFIMAALGVSRGVIQGDTAAVVVMVATITALTTPYAVRHSKSIALFVDDRFPKKWKDALTSYSVAIQRGRVVPEWRLMIRRHSLIILVNASMLGAIGILFGKVLNAEIAERFGWSFGTRFWSFTLSLVLSAPFFWGVMKGGLKKSRMSEYWLNLQLRPLLVGFMIVRAFVFLALAGFLISRFFSVPLATLVLASAAGAMILLLSSRVERIYERFVQRFLLSVSESEVKEAERDQVVASGELGPWDGHIAVFEVSYDSTAVGKTVEELRVRERYGVTVTLIERGGRKIPVPGRFERVYPLDRIHAIGTDEQLASFREFVEVTAAEPFGDTDEEGGYALESVSVGAESSFAGRSIRECGIRERANALVVGVERAGERILNPAADFQIIAGDLLWIVGQREKVRAL